jgi:asparagine synthase (glutamine-hydrolysing)
MCGILGTINRPFDDSVLNLIRHRGPDDASTDAMTVGPSRVMLGHRRLSIVDLSPAGRQPMATPCGNYTIVFNGEIYNHLDLRSEIQGEPFRGHSDTETILFYLARHGIRAVRQFNGIFAFGLVDAEKGKLYLARDPFGIKPLYYWSDAGSLVFSSEIRPVQKLVGDSIEPSNLAELLRLRYLPAPDTLFKNIRKVRPGHIVEIDLRSLPLTAREYPFVESASTERAAVPPRAELVERYGFLLEQAVTRQLMSDVEVGVFLSGGIDSALVAHFAQRHAPYKMKAFTVGFSEQHETDEIAEAGETAGVTGLDHHEVRIGFREFVETIPRITAIVEEPLATTSVVPMFHLSRLAAQHVKVVLSGQGADEAFGGYRRYQAEMFRGFVPSFAVPPLQAAARWAGFRNDTLLRGLDSIGEPDDVRRFLQVYSVFSPDQIQKLTGYPETRAAGRIRYFFDLLRCSTRRRAVERMMALDLRMSLADDLLLYTDKITMHHSIECRVPLLDLELVKFIEALPCRYRLGLWRGKVLHKQFARRVLPDSIVRRRKKGFLSPTNTWFRKQRDLVRGLLLDRSSRFSSYFDLKGVNGVLDEHANGFNRERQIFLLLGVYYWLADFA